MYQLTPSTQGVLDFRDFMSRTERYERGMALTNRIYELQLIHGWDDVTVKTAIALLDDQLPIGLHNIGVSAFLTYIHSYT